MGIMKHIKQIFRPRNLYVGYRVVRNEEEDGEIAGLKTLGVNINRIDFLHDDIDLSDFSFSKVINSTENHSMVILNTKKSVLCDYKANMFLYKLTPVYDVSEEDELEKLDISINQFKKNSISLHQELQSIVQEIVERMTNSNVKLYKTDL